MTRARTWRSLGGHAGVLVGVRTLVEWNGEERAVWPLLQAAASSFGIAEFEGRNSLNRIARLIGLEAEA